MRQIKRLTQRARRKGGEKSEKERESTAETQRKPVPRSSVVQSGFDFGFGDGAFADYVPVVAVEADYGAG